MELKTSLGPGATITLDSGMWLENIGLVSFFRKNTHMVPVLLSVSI